MSKLRTPPDRSISETDWEQTPDSVRTYVEKLVEARRRSSRNSWQPPSQDRPSAKASQSESKEPSKRKRGGQEGHVGQSRALLPISAVDEVVVYRPVCRERCGAALTGEHEAPYRHQVTELPLVKAEVVEY